MPPDEKQSSKNHAPQPEVSLDDRIAKTLTTQIESTQDCLRKVKVRETHWANDNLDIAIRLSFWLPAQDDSEGADWSTDFRAGFGKHLTSKNNIEGLFELFSAECREFIRKNLGVFRFGTNVVQKLPKIRVNRPRGRRKSALAKSELQVLRRELNAIKLQILGIKKQIPVWKREGSRNEADLKAKIRRVIPRDRFEWAQFLFSCFKKLPYKHRENERYNHKNLCDPQSWSASGWSILILQEVHYRRTGQSLPASLL